MTVRRTFALSAMKNHITWERFVNNLKTSRKCRFCYSRLSLTYVNQKAQKRPAFRDVCEEPDCLVLMEKACEKAFRCEHFCGGFRGEPQCLPCMHEDCVK